MVAAFPDLEKLCEFRLVIRFAAEETGIVRQALWQCTGDYTLPRLCSAYP